MVYIPCGPLYDSAGFPFNHKDYIINILTLDTYKKNLQLKNWIPIQLMLKTFQTRGLLIFNSLVNANKLSSFHIYFFLIIGIQFGKLIIVLLMYWSLIWGKFVFILSTLSSYDMSWFPRSFQDKDFWQRPQNRPKTSSEVPSPFLRVFELELLSQLAFFQHLKPNSHKNRPKTLLDSPWLVLRIFSIRL